MIFVEWMLQYLFTHHASGLDTPGDKSVDDKKVEEGKEAEKQW